MLYPIFSRVLTVFLHTFVLFRPLTKLFIKITTATTTISPFHPTLFTHHYLDSTILCPLSPPLLSLFGSVFGTGGASEREMEAPFPQPSTANPHGPFFANGREGVKAGERGKERGRSPVRKNEKKTAFTKRAQQGRKKPILKI